MAIASMQLDPNAASYTDNQIVDKVNAATVNITRASSVDAAARPIAAGEVGDTELAGSIPNTKLATGVAKANLDAMTDTTRGYVSTNPVTGEFKVISIHRQADGKLDVEYDNVAV